MIAMKAIKFHNEGLMERYDQSYQRFEAWALKEIMKIDSFKIFAFAIHKCNLNTYEFQKTKTGSSAALMALRGIDIDKPRQYERKEMFHYLDGESNLNLLVN